MGSRVGLGQLFGAIGWEADCLLLVWLARYRLINHVYAGNMVILFKNP